MVEEFHEVDKEQEQLFEMSAPVYSKIISSQQKNDDGSVIPFGDDKFGIHKSLLSAVTMCPDLFSRVNWKPWWINLMFIIVTIDNHGPYNAILFSYKQYC
jgi:hypothetical protein